MKRKSFGILFCALCAPVAMLAQETYENANLMGNDLNGTARYVGMGGAMEALGADISTMGTNPAGIGLFRKSQVTASAGYVGQSNDFNGENKGTASFDQAGFVYSLQTGRSSFINFGLNYHKSKNFKQILSAANSLNGASQNKLSVGKAIDGCFDLQESSNGEWTGNNYSFNQVDYLYFNALLMNSEAATYNYYNASGFNFGRSNTGYIGTYDVNISGNANDRFYWGVTVGLSDVHYNSYSIYQESLVDEANSNASLGNVAINDSRTITGTGMNLKFGVIFRPVETSPFRVGLYVHTPTWYDLSTSNYTSIDNGSSVGEYDNGHISESYDFRLATPWVFGASLGHTVGNFLALGLTYEFSDYGSTDTRVNETDDYYYDDYFYSASSSDKNMNDHTKNTLRGVSTLKLGVEYKPTSDLSVRLGYNYVSPMFEEGGSKDGTVESWGSYYSSSTDYVNWKATNRVTLGLGYNYKRWNFDIAYVYSQTDGDFYPFKSDASIKNLSGFSNVASATQVSNKRNQLLFTLGYKF